jgi:serine/threonine protein kinase/WD40 repeat protein
VIKRVRALLESYQAAGHFLASPTFHAAEVFAGAEKLASPPAVSDPENRAADQPQSEIIGPYRLLERIGEGGMGVVYMAEQQAPVRRRVALKIIKLGMDTRQIIARFEAERQALALMDHPNIARVFDAGTTETGQPYFVMELVRGTPITDYCDVNNLSVGERLELFVQVCYAAQHAHQKGIIHRDLKPQNVLVTQLDGRAVPKVIDFGVAKATGQQLTERSLFTGFMQMIGTPLYMSPEQAEMTSVDIDTRADIYSLGVMLYELLTGTTPFDRQRLRTVAFDEIRRIIRDEEPPRPSTRISTLGDTRATVAAHRKVDSNRLTELIRDDLDWIVMKALEKDRARRYATAGNMAADIERHLKHEPVEACPPTAAYRLRKFARRNRVALTTIVLVVCALMLGTVISVWQAIRATDALGFADAQLLAVNEAQDATRKQLLLTEQAEAAATRRLFDSRLAEAKAAHRSRRVGQRLESLAAVREATKLARRLNLPSEQFLDLRNTAIAALALPDITPTDQPSVVEHDAHSGDFDDELKLYARSDSKGNVTVVRVSDGTEIASLPGKGGKRWPGLSPNGQFLALFSTMPRVELWRLDEKRPIKLMHIISDGVAGEFTRDSRKFVVARENGSMRLFDLISGGHSRELQKNRPTRCVTIDPRGERLAAVCGTTVEIRDLTTGKTIIELPHQSPIDKCAWHPDGNTLVTSDNARIYVWNVNDRKQTMVLEGLRNGGTVFAFNHAGTLLASDGWDWTLRLWDLRTPKPILSTVIRISGTPRFSRDDRRLAPNSRDGRLYFFEIVAEGREYRTFARAESRRNYDRPSVRFDGRLLAVALRDGVGFWDLEGNAQLAFVDCPDCKQVLFEPSGSLLTSGSQGLYRWPVREKPETTGCFRIGPPQQVQVPGAICHIDNSRDGQMIGISQFDGGCAFPANHPDQVVRFVPHEDARYVAVSSDGRLMATGSHSEFGAKIWDATTGKLVTDLPGTYGEVGFSPDGRWLAARGYGLRLWDVASGRGGPEIGGGNFTFSADGKTLAAETSSGVLRLVDPNSGLEFARLEDPNQDRALYLTFSPDGSHLIATNDDSQSIHVWDLRLIRAELAEMGLDWDQPPFPPAKADDHRPLTVHIDLGK